MKRKVKPVWLTFLIFGFCSLILAGMAFSGNTQKKLCTLTLSFDPPGPLTIGETDSIAIVVRAEYMNGPPTDVVLDATNLPDFAEGRVDNTGLCADCTIEDTLYLKPEYCDAGIYDLRFIARAELESELGEDLVTAVDYRVIVEDLDRPCHIRAEDTVMIDAGRHLQFNIKFFDDDRTCTHSPELNWEYFGYPFDYGAKLFDSGRYIRTFSWNPNEADVGRHTITLVAEFAASVCEKDVVILVLPLDTGCVDNAPLIYAEPEFTRGTSNTIYYRPHCGAYEHEVCYFDYENPDQYLGCRMTPSKSATQADGIVEHLIEGLEDGHTYGYFVTAYFLQYPDSVALSGVTSSTQDASPPHPVLTTKAVADSGGVIRISWYGVIDDVSGVDYYQVYRCQNTDPHELQVSIPAADDNGPEFRYVVKQTLTGHDGLIEGREYHYRVNAVDLVGNRGDGIETPAVMPDSTPPCMPDVSVAYDYHFFFHSYIGSTFCEVRGESNCPGLQQADSVRFEAVRDSLKYFDAHWQEGYKYFTSGWIHYESDWVDHVFDFLPPTGGDAYVHGHTYYIRAQAKDSLGNVSYRIGNDTMVYWSKPDSVIVDLRPPDDISNLEAAADLDFTDSTAIIELTWDPAVDHVSGLDVYLIHRKAGDGAYEIIDSVTSPGYVDHNVDREQRIEFCYKIGSRDNVGNTRDLTATEWEVCARPNLGPIISVGCFTRIHGVCLVGGDPVVIFWNYYITDGVDHYIARCNDTKYLQPNGAADWMSLPIETDGRYIVKVRAVFVNGTVSTWSNIEYFTRDGTPPNPIDSLWITYDWPRPTQALLQWEVPRDETGIEGYKVLRSSENEPWTVVARTRRPGYSLWEKSTTCIVYQDYAFTVHPVDHLANEQDAGNAEITTPCLRAPIMQPLEIDGGIITARWDRALPNLSSQWYDSVLVRRAPMDDDDAFVDIDVLAVYNDSCHFDVNPHGPGIYEVRVMEIPTDLDRDIVSLWSKGETIPFNYEPDSVENLTSQPHPVPQQHAADSVGCITLAWEYTSDVIHTFEVIRFRNGTLEQVTTLRINMTQERTNHIFKDRDIYAGVDYRYCILAVDRHGYKSDTASVITRIDPLWMYTPSIMAFDPPFFNSETLRVEWQWIDTANGQRVVADTNFGAVRCSVEVSINSTFSNYIWSAPSVPAENLGQTITLDPDVLGGIRKLYCHVKAQERFGDWSPWSSAYDSLGYETITYDIIPPAPVEANDLIKIYADSSARSGVIDVHLNWQPTNDISSGVEFYIVCRDRNDDIWDTLNILDSQNTYNIDHDLDVGDVDSCEYRYTVRPKDRAGNLRVENNVIECLVPLPAPTGVAAKSKRLLEWEYDGLIDSFYAECAPDSNLLGTDLMAALDEGSGAWIPGDQRSYEFQTGEDFVKPDSEKIFFHIKAMWNGDESSWSGVPHYPQNSASEPVAIPASYSLEQNYPNPFNPTTSISYSLPKRSSVTLVVYNINGAVVRTLVDSDLDAGQYRVPWDGTDNTGVDVASGIYFYRLRADNIIRTKKMILVR